MGLFDLQWICLTIFNYPLSVIEVLGIFSGLLSVYLATRGNILTWPIGIINEIAFFAIFFQVQLYSDMFLQVFFFVISVYGWLNWSKEPYNSRIKKLVAKDRAYLFCFLVLSTVILGLLVSNLHLMLPSFFEKSAAYPYQDSFTTCASIIATFLLARRYVDNWYLWIAVDLVSVWLYFSRGIIFLSALYFIFLMLASLGCIMWEQKYASRPHSR